MQIESIDFASLMPRYDGPTTLFYVDPPYFPDTRVTQEVYRHELSRERHKELAEMLNRLQVMVVLSGYNCPEHEEWYGHWERHDFNAVCSSSGVGGTGSTKGQKRPRRVESVWLSPAVVQARGNISCLTSKNHNSTKKE